MLYKISYVYNKAIISLATCKLKSLKLVNSTVQYLFIILYCQLEMYNIVLSIRSLTPTRYKKTRKIAPVKRTQSQYSTSKSRRLNRGMKPENYE